MDVQTGPAFPKPKPGNYLIMVNDGEATAYVEGSRVLFEMSEQQIVALLDDALDALYAQRAREADDQEYAWPTVSGTVAPP